MTTAKVISSLSLVAVILIVTASAAAAAEPSAEDIEFFEKQVRPVLVESCQKCHGDRKQEGGLRLDSRETALKGGDSGPAIDPGKPGDSLLVEAIGYTGDIKMPPKGKLAEAQIAALTEWVRRGAPWPADRAAAGKPGEFDLAARKARQWALQPVKPQIPPEVHLKSWPLNPIDNFILAKLAQAGLTPAPAAYRRTLLRRVTFELVGLPPTPTEIDDFLADDSPMAFERVVDRLLSSPHYGECWARHWLDLVRYAETRGHEFDMEIPLAWEYRDYIIRALNADLPYDQFVREHVAGDLLANPRRHPSEGFNESIIGTGFWHLGEATHSPVDIRADEAGRADNQIDVFAKAFLAQTVACARCHDHKFDAISTKDYYALSGYLQSSRYAVTCIDPPERRAEIVRQLTALRDEETRLLSAVADQTARSSAEKISKLLMASLAVLHPEYDKSAGDAPPGSAALEARIAIAAKKHQIETEGLTAWVTFLQGPAFKSPTDPFHLWALLARQTGELSRDAIAAFLQQQRAGQGDLDRERALAQGYVVFEDFSRSGIDGWFVEGKAFGTAPPEGTLALSGGRVAHSGHLSGRLEGVLRSRTFTIAQNRILYHMAGKNAKVNLIIDNFQLIRAPIYGGLTIALENPDQMQWFAQDVSKWVGHNAYIELIDPGDGFVAVDTILFSDKGPPAESPNPVTRCLLDVRDVDSIEMLVQKFARLIERSLAKRTDDAKLQATAEFDRAAESSMRAFLLTHDLEGALPRTLAVSRPESNKQLAEIRASKQRLENEISYAHRALVMIDGTPEDDRVHVRGSPHKFGDVVPRRFLEALGGTEQPVSANGSGRLDLARQMTDPANPLVARVIVNRIWKYHFGEGLVRTPDDFGNMGQPPTHPELLDWLATEFMHRGWSIKQLHRMILGSRTYQMSSRAADQKVEEVDPENKLWHRMALRRLEAETIRDSVLAVSGRLDPEMSGPGVMPHLTPFLVGRGRPAASGPLDGAGRRSVYLAVNRNFLNPMLLAFDSPIPFTTIGRRSVSNVPAQALALMNNPFVVEQSEVWARRMLADLADAKSRIQAMYLAAFSRPATADEVQNALAFIENQSRQYPPGETLRPWSDLAHVLFNVKEFIFIE
jgi:cytochrome c553